MTARQRARIQAAQELELLYVGRKVGSRYYLPVFEETTQGLVETGLWVAIIHDLGLPAQDLIFYVRPRGPPWWRIYDIQTDGHPFDHIASQTWIYPFPDKYKEKLETESKRLVSVIRSPD